MFFAIAVITVQGFTSHDKTFSISDDFAQESSGIENGRNTLFKTILERNGLYKTMLSIIAVPLPLLHIIHKRLLQNVFFTEGKAQTVFQILLVIDNQSRVTRLRKEHPSAVQKKICALSDGLQLAAFVIGLPKSVRLSVTKITFT